MEKTIDKNCSEKNTMSFPQSIYTFSIFDYYPFNSQSSTWWLTEQYQNDTVTAFLVLLLLLIFGK